MKHIRRTVLVLAGGVAMALVAHSGQTQYADNFQKGLLKEYAEIRRLDVKGVRVVYSLGRSEMANSADMKNDSRHFQTSLSEVVLSLALLDPVTGRPIPNASVYVTARTPRGGEVQARARELAGIYLTTLDLPSEGRYYIELAAEVHGTFLQDHFCYDTH